VGIATLKENNMKYIINHSQLASFIRRRFSIEELNQIISSVKEQIEDGESVDTAVYDTIRHYLSLKKPSDISDDGAEQQYWDSYIKYETPLVEFVKYTLGLD
jgi:hypothetical protein